MATRKGSDNRFPLVRLLNSDDTPATPPTGEGHLVAGADKVLRWIDDDGTLTVLGGSGVADILDLPTAETDDTLVLAPDGAGGVEFRAEAGGGGITTAYLGTNAVGGTQVSPANNALVAKSVTPGANGVLQNIGIYHRENSDSLHFITVAVFANNGGAIGKLLALSRTGQYGPTNNSSFADNDSVSVPGWVAVPITLALTSGTTYWIGVQFNSGAPRIYYDAGGSDRTWTAGGDYLVDGGRFSQSDSTRNYSIRALFLS